MTRMGLPLALWLLGCATQPIEPVRQFDVAPVVDVASAEPSQLVLGVRPFEAAKPYRQPVVIRTSPFELTIHPSAEWSQDPAMAVTRATTDAIIATNRFADVGDSRDLTRPDLVLIGNLRKYELDRTVQPWEAVCAARLELRDALSRKAVWTNTLTANVPLSQNALDALPEAMSEAVSNLAKQAATAIADASLTP